MFVTNESAYNILNKKYSVELEGIMLVLLERKKYNNEIKLSDFADDKMIEALLNILIRFYEEKEVVRRIF